MKELLKKLNLLESKSALERHAILKNICKKHGFKSMFKAMSLKISRTPKSQINSVRILKSDMKWARKRLSKLRK